MVVELDVTPRGWPYDTKSANERVARTLARMDWWRWMVGLEAGPRVRVRVKAFRMHELLDHERMREEGLVALEFEFDSEIRTRRIEVERLCSDRNLDWRHP